MESGNPGTDGKARALRPHRVLAWTVTLAYAVCLGMAMARHEMWRDEIQAWLLARDAPSWWGVLDTIRYEGHPGAWHLLLWPFARLSWNPVWMQVAHAGVASTAVWTFVRFAPFGWPVRMLLPFGYVLFFEWGVIARNYALSALFLFLFCAAFARRWRRFPWAAAALAAACHTNVHTLVLVIVLTPLLMVEYAVAVAGRWHGADRCKGRVAAGFLLVLLGIATSVRQIVPPADSGFATGWHWRWEPQRAAQATVTLLRAHAPVPSTEDGSYWNSCRALERLAGSPGARDRPEERLVAVARGTVLAAVLLAAALLARRPWFLVHWVGGTVALIVFFHVKYPGSLRHHVFHWMWAVTVLWLAWEHRPWQTGRARLDRVFGWADFLGLHAALLASAAFQLWGAGVAVGMDSRQVFSNAKAAGDWLRTQGWQGDADVCFAGQRSPEISATVGYAQLARIFYLGQGAWGSYVVWTEDYDRSLRGRWLADALGRLREVEGKSLVFLSSAEVPDRSLPEGMALAAHFAEDHAADPVWIYRWEKAEPESAPPAPSGTP